jgi:hypothetical protein
METKPSIKAQNAAIGILNVITNNIPYVGTAISEGLYDYWGRVKQDRLNKFTEMFGMYLKEVSQDDFDEEYLRSEDFAMFFEIVLRKVTETKSNTKLEIFRDILLGKMKSKSSNDFSETFLNIISQLNEKQIEILSVLSRPSEESTELHSKIRSIKDKIEDQRIKYQDENSANVRNAGVIRVDIENKKLEDLQYELNKLLKVDETNKKKWNSEYTFLFSDEMAVNVGDLEAKGLIKYTDGRTAGRFDGGIGFPFYLMTEFGKQFVKFIKQ